MFVSNNAKKRAFVGFWSISQAVHPCVLRDHCGGSAPLCKVHSSAGFGGHCLLTAVVVDLAVQRLRGDDPRGRTPPLQRVRSFHTFLDLLSWAWFAILWGVTYWRTKKPNQNKKNRIENSIMRKVKIRLGSRVVTYVKQNTGKKIFKHRSHCVAEAWQVYQLQQLPLKQRATFCSLSEITSVK